jgi:heme/copper-type cytochrome/quinol oxidase subunit 1
MRAPHRSAAAFVFAFVVFLTCDAMAAESAEPLSSAIFSYCLLGAIVLAMFACFVALRAALWRQGWSLREALSEKTAIRSDDSETSGVAPASVSRLIALIGFIAFLTLYVGFGLAAMRRLAAGSPLPDREQFGDVELFLCAGATMFLPYLANKLEVVVKWRLRRGLAGDESRRRDPAPFSPSQQPG